MKQILISFLMIAPFSLQAAILLNMTNDHHLTGVDANADESPGIQEGGISGSNWNEIDTGLESTIVDDAGTTLTGVSVDVGVETGTGTTLNYSTDPSFNDLGLEWSSGIYAGNAKSAIFSGDGTSDSKSGIRVIGLGASVYTVYVSAKNTNNDGDDNGTDAYDIFYGTVASASGNTDFSGFSSSSMTNASTDWDTVNNVKVSAPTTWTLGDNYVSFDVTIAAGQDLVIVSDGTTTDENRGFLNTVEIVAIPEPGSLALVAVALTSLFMFRTRRKK